MASNCFGPFRTPSIPFGSQCTPRSERHKAPGGLWYEPGFPESRVIEVWNKISEGLCDQWNVFAMDLQNEPWAASWGDGSANLDWSRAASRIGRAVQAKCPRWLLFVEGVGNFPGASGKSWEQVRASLVSHELPVSSRELPASAQ